MPDTAEPPCTACARCGAALECAVGEHRACWCSELNLAPATLRTLSERYRGCLCPPCLRAFSASHENAPRP